MSKRIFLFLMLLGFVAQGTAYADTVNVSKSAYPSEDASVAINDAGEIGVVWVEKVSTANQQVYFSIHRGGGWSSPAVIRGQSGISANPCISKGVGGGFAAAWHDQTSNCIRFSKYNGSWSTPVTVSQVGGYDFGNPAITTTTNGRIAVAWQRGNPRFTDVYVAIYKTGWSNPVNVSNTPYASKYPDLNSGPGGEIYVVWQDNLYNPPEDDWLRTMINNDRGSGNWTKSSAIDDIEGWCFHPVVAVNSHSDILSCYYYKQARSYYATFKLNGAWQTPQNISDIGNHQDHDRYYSDVCTYGGSAFLYIYRDCAFNIIYTVAQEGNSGKAVALTSSKQCYRPSIDYRSSVGAAAAWTDRSGNNDVFVSIFDPVDPDIDPDPGPDPDIAIQPPLGTEANYLNIPLTAPELKVESIVNRNLFTVQYFRKLTWAFDPSWNDWDITLSKFRIYRKLRTTDSWETLAEVGPSVLLYIDKNGVTEEDRFDYQVRGVDDLGNDFYAYNWIRWAPNPANAEQGIKIKNYNVYRKRNDQSASKFSRWQSVDAATNSLEDHSTEIREQVQYDYAVTAVSVEGEESDMALAHAISGSAILFFHRDLLAEKPE
jgi:hypothetical protein